MGFGVWFDCCGFGCFTLLGCLCLIVAFLFVCLSLFGGVVLVFLALLLFGVLCVYDWCGWWVYFNLLDRLVSCFGLVGLLGFGLRCDYCVNSVVLITFTGVV